ncbi:hypothetical protein F8388_018865 [Cannabis sativa]|uniref:DUF8039 domain-containing protein n=1 Tax=Cannabis sativa TaxID=3483 RepID=A0A7J6FZN3_CANSA|nr:hypothetical protein F8388_018865 [Cannabis sativa]
MVKVYGLINKILSFVSQMYDPCGDDVDDLQDDLEVDLEDDLEDDDGVGEENSSQKPSRGPSLLPRLIQSRSEGRRIFVDYNVYGQPTGIGRVDMSSMLGSTVRRLVSILCNCWKEVLAAKKREIWEVMNKTFELDRNHKTKILSHAAARFRNWKTYLTNNWVLKGIKERSDEFPPRKPKGYEKLIPDEDWKKFVESRISEEWLALRKKMQDVRAMNKYNHKLGRGGYVRAEAELEKQLGHQLNGFDRADLWSRARTDNKGELSEDAKEIKQKIDHYRELQEKGEWEPQGSEDVLTKALGTPEERGRVRGVGFGVTPTQFWNTPRPRSSKGKEKQILTSDVEQRFCEQEEGIRKQEELVRQQQDQICKQQELFRQQQEAFHREQELFRRQQEELMRKMFQEQYSWRGSCGAPSGSNSGEQYQDACGQLIQGCVYVPQPPATYYVPDPPLEPPPMPECRKCRLAIQSRDNIVALEFHLDTRPNDFNVDMGEVDCHVTIQHPIQGAAPLPYPMVDMDVCVVSQATGVVIAWPKHLVIFHDWTDQDALVTKSRHSAAPLT